jgi:hypothetical protein
MFTYSLYLKWFLPFSALDFLRIFRNSFFLFLFFAVSEIRRMDGVEYIPRGAGKSRVPADVAKPQDNSTRSKTVVSSGGPRAAGQVRKDGERRGDGQWEKKKKQSTEADGVIGKKRARSPSQEADEEHSKKTGNTVTDGTKEDVDGAGTKGEEGATAQGALVFGEAAPMFGRGYKAGCDSAAQDAGRKDYAALMKARFGDDEEEE